MQAKPTLIVKHHLILIFCQFGHAVGAIHQRHIELGMQLGACGVSKEQEAMYSRTISRENFIYLIILAFDKRPFHGNDPAITARIKTAAPMPMTG